MLLKLLFFLFLSFYNRWRGNYGGKENKWFPANYVEEIVESEPGDTPDMPLLGSLQKDVIDLRGVTISKCWNSGGVGWGT